MAGPGKPGRPRGYPKTGGRQKGAVEKNIMIDSAVGSYLQGAKAKGIADYVAAGRKLRSLPETALREDSIAAFKNYAANPKNRRVEFTDCDAEFALRGLPAPYDAVTEERANLIAEASRVAEQMTEEERNEFGLDIVEQYLDEQNRRN